MHQPKLPPPPTPDDPATFRRIVGPLAAAETLVWAAIYYAFPALLPVWERDLGWSKTQISGAFTAALITTALLAPLIGRTIDRGFGVRIFTGSALLGATGLVALSRVNSVWQFYAVWILLGVAMAGSLYEACFAVLTKTMGSRRKQAITVVTLVAGFAGTISFPGIHLLVETVGWRTGVLVQAAVVACIAAPLILVGSRRAMAQSKAAPKPAAAGTDKRNGLDVTADPVFRALAVGFACIALNHAVLLTHLLPLLDERGIAASTAVLVAALIGPMQVAGRVMMLGAERRYSSLAIFSASFLAMALASLLLMGSAVYPLLVFGFVICQGAGVGVTSILRPVVTADLLGFENFGLISGLLAIPFMSAVAAAPTVAALVWTAGGYGVVIWFAFGAALLGLIMLLVAGSVAAGRR